MSGKKLLSILIPAYNAAEYIYPLLNNVYVNISEKQESQLEVLLIDDGSADNLFSVVHEYTQFKSFRYVKKENTGVANTRNFGLNMVESEFVWMIDSDDLLEPTFLPFILEELKETKYDMIRLNYTNDLTLSNPQKFHLTEEDNVLKKYVSAAFKSYVWQFILRSDVFIGKVEFPSGYLYEDLAVMYEILSLYDSGKAGYIDEKIYKYRIRSNSIVHTPGPAAVESVNYLVTKFNEMSGKYTDEMRFLVSSTASQIAFDSGRKDLYQSYSKSVKLDFFLSDGRFFNLRYWAKYVVVHFPMLRKNILTVKRILGIS